MSNEDDECDSASLFTVATNSDVNRFLHSQAAKITGVQSYISDNDDDDSSMDGSLLARFAQMPAEKKFHMKTNSSIRLTPMKPYLSRSCFASITSSSSPIKTNTSTQKLTTSDDLTELKWLNTFKLKELKDDFNPNDLKDKELNEKKNLSSDQNEQNNNTNTNTNNNDEDRLAKLISELKSYDHENSKNNNLTSLGILIFLALYSKRDDKPLPWSLTIKQLYEYAQLNAKQITNKRGWKNLLRQALITIPCFVKTKRDLLKSRSLWTIDPYYRPLLTKAYLTTPPTPSPSANKTLSEASTNRHNDQIETNRSAQSVENNFAPKATVKSKVLPRLYERLCEENVNEDDEADSSSIVKQHRSLTAGRKRPRSSSSSTHRQSIKDNEEKRRLSTSPWTAKLLKRHKRRHHRSSDNEPKTSTPNRGSHSENRSSTIITPCPSMDHNYLLPTKQTKQSPKKQTNNPLTTSQNTEEEEEDDDDDENDEDDERDSSSLKRKSIITTRAQAAAARKNRRKSSPPKKRLSLPSTSHRPNTRINRRIIEHDLKLLRQANVLPPLSPPTNQQPLDLSLGPNRSSSYEEIIEKTSILQPNEQTIQTKTTTPIEGVLDLSLSR